MQARKPVRTAVVVADAPTSDLEPYSTLIRESDLRVAADGGARHFLQAGILPDIAIGDFDSLPSPLLDQLSERGVAIERHPAEKDETDLELALLYAVEREARRITVLAALGGRPDQHLANVQLLSHPALAACDVRMLHEGWEVFAITKTTRISGRAGQTVSLLPMTERVEGIVTEGLHYPLRNEVLRLGPARGVSNVMTSTQAVVTIRSGILLVMHACHESELQ